MSAERIILCAYLEFNFCAGAFADPVFLHSFDLVGPVEGVDVGQEFVGVGGDFEEPLFHFLFFDFRSAAPAVAVFDLFVGEDGLVNWAPPLVGFFLVGEAFFVELEEAPLSPFVVFGGAGVDFSAPVDGVTEFFELVAEVFDVSVGGDFGGGAGFDGVVFGGEAEGVIAEGAENVKTLLGVVASEDVDDGEVTDVADVEASARGVGEHFGEEFFGFFGGVVGLESFGVFPDFLPFGFDC